MAGVLRVAATCRLKRSIAVGPARLDQVARHQEAGEVFDLRGGRGDRGPGRDIGGDPLDIAQVPAGQDFELQPADPEEAVGDGIVQRPGRRAVQCPGTLVQRQLIPQRQQTHRGRLRGGIDGRGTGLCRHGRRRHG